MTATSRLKVPNEESEKLKCSLGTASALFDMSDEDFVKRYVRTNRIRSDRLHQFEMRHVLKLYEKEKPAIKRF